MKIECFCSREERNTAKRLESIKNDFENLLEEKDMNYSKKIEFKIFYNEQLQKYQADIIKLPEGKDFVLQHYFKRVLGGEKFSESALEIGIACIKLSV